MAAAAARGDPPERVAVDTDDIAPGTVSVFKCHVGPE